MENETPALPTGQTAPGTEAKRLPKTASLLNKSQVHEFALAYASKRKLADGSPRFNQISKDWYAKLEAQLKGIIRNQIDGLPSAGRTIR